MWNSGCWQDTTYAACAFSGARSKQQRLRHNVDEISQWPLAECHHIHDPAEWTPVLRDGERLYPSKEEAEYTAELCFAIAVSVSWWATRLGLAKLHVPRSPAPQCYGHRTHWLTIDPRALREWAMTPVALTLGLRPLHPLEAARVPLRVHIHDVLPPDSLPDDCIYVGQGHQSHRIPTTKWKCPVQPGVNVTPDEWLPTLVSHVQENLMTALPELTGKRLACDCALGHPCEADVLAGMVFDITQPQAQKPAPQVAPYRRPKRRSRLSRLIFLANPASLSTAAFAPRYFTQEALVLAYRRLFPEEWLHDMKFPYVEDLINSAPFDLFARWKLSQGWDGEGSCDPCLSSSRIRQLCRNK